MRVIIVGLGIQGKKRKAVAGEDVVGTVDVAAADVQYERIEQVPLDSFDAALVCTPDQTKLEIVNYLLSRGKHTLVEKPLLATDERQLHQLASLSQSMNAVCYTAYNHRFEPHIARLKAHLNSGMLGELYFARVFYGNGTALDVKKSPWRDQAIGVLSDIGSHLLDIVLFLFGRVGNEFQLWSYDRFENRACDHVFFGSRGEPVLELEATLLSWRNTFTLDVFGERGSAHIDCLCKWGPSTYTLRQRVLPSGRPIEEIETIECPDPTWALEYEHFKKLCLTGGTNVENDLWINSVLTNLALQAGEKVL